MLAFFGVLSSKQSPENPEPLLKDPNPNYGLSVLNIDASESVADKGATEPSADAASIGSPPTADAPVQVTDVVSDAIPAAESATESGLLHPHSEQVSAASDRPKIPSRLSVQRLSLNFFHGNRSEPVLTHEAEVKERRKAADASKRAFFNFSGPLSSEKRVHESAMVVQKVIVGSSAVLPSNGNVKSSPVTKAQLLKIRSDLTQPKAANKLIAHLRALPLPAAPTARKASSSDKSAPTGSKSAGPIHAVCLQGTDEEIEKQFFSRFESISEDATETVTSVPSASIKSILKVFEDMHVVTLISTPDLGIGNPGDGDGLLAGAIPSPETVAGGFCKITPELLGLGYATGQAVLPNHAGVYPPTDRISVLTYWWGLEVVLPEPTIRYLSAANSISHALVNLLTVLAVMSGGVREILPFVRYISQFIDFEWSAIKAQDKGKGVVCAATWLMPAALVPRSWDFPDPPKTKDAVKAKTSSREGANNQGENFSVQIAPSPSLPAVVVTPPSAIKSNPESANPKK